MIRFRHATAFLGVGLLVLSLAWLAPLRGQPKPEPPKAICAVPIGVRAGQPARFTVRGLRLETVTEIRFHEPKTFGKVSAPGGAKGPDRPEDLPRVGNSKLEVDTTIPEDVHARLIPFTLFSPTLGLSESRSLLVLPDVPVISEKEPNNGFRTAQLIPVPSAVQGVIEHPHDVDVFRIEGRAGRLLRCEVFAARCGSALDSVLTLYDAAGQELAANDDYGGSADSFLEVKLPRDGTYYVSLLDSLDSGGPGHAYCVVVTAER